MNHKDLIIYRVGYMYLGMLYIVRRNMVALDNDK